MHIPASIEAVRRWHATQRRSGWSCVSRPEAWLTCGVFLRTERKHRLGAPPVERSHTATCCCCAGLCQLFSCRSGRQHAINIHGRTAAWRTHTHAMGQSTSCRHTRARTHRPAHLVGPGGNEEERPRAVGVQGLLVVVVGGWTGCVLCVRVCVCLGGCVLGWLTCGSRVEAARRRMGPRYEWRHTCIMHTHTTSDQAWHLSTPHAH
jgi:hypothetical protein